MKLGRKLRPEIEIQVTSIADMAFLLLIFFVKTTTLARDMGTQMNIPATQPGVESKANDKVPTILLNGTSIKYQANDPEREMPLEELRQKLKDERFPERAPEKRIVVVEGQENVDYQQFYSVIAAVDAAGGVVTLMTDLSAKGEESGGGASAPAATGAVSTGGGGP